MAAEGVNVQVDPRAGNGLGPTVPPITLGGAPPPISFGGTPPPTEAGPTAPIVTIPNPGAPTNPAALAQAEAERVHAYKWGLAGMKVPLTFGRQEKIAALGGGPGAGGGAVNPTAILQQIAQLQAQLDGLSGNNGLPFGVGYSGGPFVQPADPVSLQAQIAALQAQYDQAIQAQQLQQQITNLGY